MDKVSTTPACRQGDPGFEPRRKSLVWQAIKPDRYPFAIWTVTSEDDVADALRYARAHALRVSIVSGGHSYIGNGVQDGTLLLDMSRLDAAMVDPETSTGWVQPGLRVAAFDAELERAGLGFPIGHEPNVGLVGYLLGGGLGWNADHWNFVASCNVTGADIVLASGEHVVADAGRHADLFWAVKGAGPCFPGVVAKLHVAVFPRPAAICKNVYVFRVESVAEVVAWLAGPAERKDNRIELSLTLSFRPTAGNEGALEKHCIVTVIAFADTDAQASALCEPFARSVPEALLVSRRQGIRRSFRTLLDDTKSDPALRRAVESIWTDDPWVVARKAAEIFEAAPSPHCLIDIALRGPRDLPADLACSVAGRAMVFIEAAWTSAADDGVNQHWMDDVLVSLQPHEKGAYISETDWNRRPERLAKCFSRDARDRLLQLKSRYDPANVFVTPMKDSVP